MDKPFLTITQQVELLQSRGVQTDADTPRILLAEGYYSVINGYKTPFIDETAAKSAGEDRYLAGTTFHDIYSLFRFDRELRELTFHYLIRVEASVRTICAHTFSERHRGYGDYLERSNYSTEDEYRKFGLDNYGSDWGKLKRKLENKAAKSRRDPIVHYRRIHGGVPLWVLANDLTFGEIEHFFNLMRPDERRAVCKRISEVTNRLGDRELGFFSPDEARVSLDTLVKARNICAHDERLYCARIGERKSDTYASVLRRMRRFVSEGDYSEMLARINSLVKRYSGPGGTLGHVIAGMGLSATHQENIATR